MRIAQVVCTFPPYQGGVGNSAYHFARLSAGQGHEVTVFTPAYSRAGKNNQWNNIFEIKRLTPLLRYGNGAFLPQLLFKLKGFDFVHLHYPFFGGAETVWLAELLGRNFKLLIHYHMDVVGLPWQVKLLSWPTALIRGSLFKLADKITCASLDYIEHSNIAEVHKKNPRIFEEIPFGVDTEKFKHANRGLKRAQEGSRGLKVLFVGGLDKAHYFKGVDILLQAFSQLSISQFRNCQLSIIGEGELKPVYQRQANELGINKRVQFLGKVSNEELVAQYQAANVMVLPSINQNEAFGMVLLEAMACGTPVIASRLPGVRTVFEDGRQGLHVDPGNADDLKNKLEQLLADNETRLAMGKAGRKLVEENYSWEKVGEKLNSIYNQLK